MGSKSKWIGLIILLAVIGAAAIYLLLGGGPRPEPAVLRGYVGGEKIGLLEDEAVQDILDRNYGLTLDYAKAGSLDMVTADHEGRNFLFPSSQTALEYYQQLYGAPDKSQIVFNTPIVLYTHRPILEAFQKEGLVTERDGVYYMDMAGLVEELNKRRDAMHPVLLAAYAHRRLVDIHPFQDGNGRTARLLMNLILVNRGYCVVSIPPILRHDYITALQQAQRAQGPSDTAFIRLICECELEAQKDYCRMFRIKLPERRKDAPER